MRRAGPVTGARAGLVLLHGRGASSADILGLARAAGLQDVAIIAPDAPGGTWWPTSFLAPSAVIEPHVQAAVAAVGAAVAQLEADGLARSAIWLAGFSQGAGLALETFARIGEGLAGVLAPSGGLVGTSDAPGTPDPALYGHTPKRFDYPGRRDGARVWISVHEQDPHIPLSRVRESRMVMQALGAEVESAVYPGHGHSVMAEDLQRLGGWVGRP